MKNRLARYWRSIDVSYPIICLLLSAISVVTLVSVAQHGQLALEGMFGDWKPALTQVFASVLGILCMFIVSLPDYSDLAECWPLHAVCWALVLLTFVPGIGYEPPGTGSRSWIAMPLGMSFQPTEIAKISFTLSFAAHLARVKDTLNRPKSLLPVLLHMALPFVLVHLQGDDGTAIVFLAIGGIMLVAAGLNRWVVAGLAVAAAAAAPFVWQYGMSAYQRQRVLGLFNPQPYAEDIMYQQLRGYEAISGGGLWGRGLFQPQHSYVPRPENDFIFSYFAESCGFIGCLVLFGLLFGLLGKLLVTAARARERTGAYLCIGVFAAVLFQTVVNLGMNLLLLPVMGLTLPFISAGGTSVLMLYICMGLVLSVGRRRRMMEDGRLARRTFFDKPWPGSEGEDG